MYRLDGCYVIKSNLHLDIDKDCIHKRYKDLYKVERNFRTAKTEMLEMRPWFVRKKTSSKAHAFIVMLSILLVRELEKAWNDVDLTVQEGLNQLNTLTTIYFKVKGKEEVQRIPKPNETCQTLLDKLNIKLPTSIPISNNAVDNKTKLHRTG